MDDGTQHDRADDPRGDACVGAALEATLDAIHRARSRPEVGRALAGPGGEQLTATDRWLLARLQGGGPARMSALADWQEVDRSTMTAQVRRLEQQGWVDRRRDPADGRAVLVHLSPDGERIVEHVRRTGREATDRLVAGWTPEDRATLATLLGRFEQELGSLGGERHTPSPGPE